MDIDIEGLLILTNNGKTAHNIHSPKKNVYKKYYALVEGLVTDEDVVLFRNEDIKLNI